MRYGLHNAICLFGRAYRQIGARGELQATCSVQQIVELDFTGHYDTLSTFREAEEAFPTATPSSARSGPICDARQGTKGGPSVISASKGYCRPIWISLHLSIAGNIASYGEATHVVALGLAS